MIAFVMFSDYPAVTLLRCMYGSRSNLLFVLSTHNVNVVITLTYNKLYDQHQLFQLTMRPKSYNALGVDSYTKINCSVKLQVRTHIDHTNSIRC